MERTEMIVLKATPAEKAMLRERAERYGNGNLSDFLRRSGMGQLETDGRRRRAKSYSEPLVSEFEERVARYAKSMPRRNAEMVVRREMAKEAA